MDCRFLHATSRDWPQTLDDLPHDVYHVGAYVALAATEEHGEALGFVASDADGVFFAPLIVRQLPPHLRQDGAFLDAICPRGYPGPLYRAAGGDFLGWAIVSPAQLRGQVLRVAGFEERASSPIVDDFGHGPESRRDHGRATCKRLDDSKTKSFVTD